MKREWARAVEVRLRRSEATSGGYGAAAVSRNVPLAKLGEDRRRAPHDHHGASEASLALGALHVRVLRPCCRRRRHLYRGRAALRGRRLLARRPCVPELRCGAHVGCIRRREQSSSSRGREGGPEPARQVLQELRARTGGARPLLSGLRASGPRNGSGADAGGRRARPPSAREPGFAGWSFAGFGPGTLLRG